MKLTKVNIKEILTDRGFECTNVSVLRWGHDHLEFGRAKLVANLRHGTAYSIQSLQQLSTALKDGGSFYIEHTVGNDYNFGVK